MESRIRNVRHMFPIHESVPSNHLMDVVLLEHLPKDMVSKMLAAGLPKDPHLQPVKDKNATARIEHGKWLVNCPTQGCYAAYYVTPEDPRIFCVFCNNLDNGGRWVRVIFPTPPDQAAIEALLSQRLDPLNQNWFPWETVKDLQKENADPMYQRMIAR